MGKEIGIPCNSTSYMVCPHDFGCKESPQGWCSADDIHKKKRCSAIHPNPALGTGEGAVPIDRDMLIIFKCGTEAHQTFVSDSAECNFIDHYQSPECHRYPAYWFNNVQCSKEGFWSIHVPSGTCVLKSQRQDHKGPLHISDICGKDADTYNPHGVAENKASGFLDGVVHCHPDYCVQGEDEGHCVQSSASEKLEV